MVPAGHAVRSFKPCCTTAIRLLKSHKVVKVDLKAVGYRIVIDPGCQTACTDKSFAIKAAALCN